MEGERSVEEWLRTRRFWGALLVQATTVGLFALEELTPAELAESMGLVVSMYLGSVAVEDGLARAFRLWLRAQEGRGPAGAAMAWSVASEGDGWVKP